MPSGLLRKKFLGEISGLAQAKPLYKTDRTFQVWDEGTQPKQILTDDMMWQKINYIHDNPVRRGYVDHPEDWRYSSARDYIGTKGIIPVSIFSS